MLLPSDINTRAIAQVAGIAQLFPPNIVQSFDPSVQKQIINYLVSRYALPLIMERQDFDSKWDNILNAANLSMDRLALQLPVDSRLVDQQKDKAEVTDSLIYDTIDQLTILNGHISFEEGLPVKFKLPDYFSKSQTEFYKPQADRVETLNALLEWNCNQINFPAQHELLRREYYTYGIALADVGFDLRIAPNMMRNNANIVQQVAEIEKIATTLNPISLRRLWANYRLPLQNINLQSCIFYMQLAPKWSVLQNVYDPATNPFGYLNQEVVVDTPPTYLFSAEEIQSWRNGVQKTIKQGDNTLPEILRAENSIEAVWTFHAMLPIVQDGQGNFQFIPDNPKVPLSRWIVQTFGSTLLGEQQIILRLQPNFYPKQEIPIIGTTFLKSLDAGFYNLSIAEILERHFQQLTTVIQQYIKNKDLINEPPYEVSSASPSLNENPNQPNKKLIVNAPGEIQWRTTPDATSTTVNIYDLLRRQGERTGRITDAVRGQAMGQRTSASEANNAFSIGMSGITQDVNSFNMHICGAYAKKFLAYTNLWFSSDLVKEITGLFGTKLDPEDFWMPYDVESSVGTEYIKRVETAQNLRYILETTIGDPSVRRSNLLLDIAKLWRLPNPKRYIVDEGIEHQIKIATDQAINTYNGIPQIVDPAQDHLIAIEVKSSFIKDLDSVFNRQNPMAAQELIKQIEVHQQFALLQMQQQMQQQAAMETDERMGLAGKKAKAASNAKDSGDERQQTGR